MSNIILAIGALVIFGTFLSSSTKVITCNAQIAEQSEYYIAALSLAQSIIDEAKAKAFDQKAILNGISAANLLTAPGSLGTESGELFPYPDTVTSLSPYSPTMKGYKSTYMFNDIDDYRNYSRVVNTQRAEGYQVRVSVNYASETSPDSIKAISTFCKTMSVQVTSPYFPKHRVGGALVPDTLTLSYAFTY